MPNSLKVKLSKLRYKGQITNDEYKELIIKLDGHDEKVKADERAKVVEQLLADLSPCVYCLDSTDCDKDYFFEDCAKKEWVSWNELRLILENLKVAEE